MTLDMMITFDITPKLQPMEKTVDNLDFIKVKNFCSVKDKVKGMRRQVTDWKKIFAQDTSNNGYDPNICKEIFKLNSKKTNNLIKK